MAFLQLFSCAVLAAVVALVLSSPMPIGTLDCDGQDELPKSACACCKMRCWDGVSQEAVQIVGRQLDESETFDTVRVIQQCVLANCADVCSGAHRAARFNAALLSN